VPQELREEWLKKDPIKRFEEYLQKKKILTATRKDEIEARIKGVINDAVDFAEHSPEADPSTVADFVFVPAGPIALIGSPQAQDPRYINALDRRTGQPFTTINNTHWTLPEEVGKR
jgi:hypothetical protein